MEVDRVWVWKAANDKQGKTTSLVIYVYTPDPDSAMAAASITNAGQERKQGFWPSLWESLLAISEAHKCCHDGVSYCYESRTSDNCCVFFASRIQ